jgi:hypothetical protein
MQIGGRDEARDDSDAARLGRASKITFDASGNEAYIADGYRGESPSTVNA